MAAEDIKTCSECQKTLPKTDFYSKRNALYSRCKRCVSKNRKSHYQQKISLKNKPKINISIMHYKAPLSINENEFLSILEAFLIEEFIDEQRSNGKDSADRMGLCSGFYG